MLINFHLTAGKLAILLSGASSQSSLPDLKGSRKS